MRFVGIDPSTSTGLVILDIDGNVIDSTEFTPSNKFYSDVQRISIIIENTLEQLEPNDQVCIEGFGFASQKGFLLGGIGWGIRREMYIRGIRYTEVAPNSLKKFASGNGKVKKNEILKEVFKRWGFDTSSDNVADAYVLAQIARHLHLQRKGKVELPKYQIEVLEVLLK